jgi:hypothetical protein
MSRDTPAADRQLSVLDVARRHDVQVSDVYQAVIDGALPATLPDSARSSLTVSAEAAQAWVDVRRARAAES